jgi:hypothetical protein
MTSARFISAWGLYPGIRLTEGSQGYASKHKPRLPVFAISAALAARQHEQSRILSTASMPCKVPVSARRFLKIRAALIERFKTKLLG